MRTNKNKFFRSLVIAFDSTLSEFLVIGSIVFVFLTALVIFRNQNAVLERFEMTTRGNPPVDTSSTTVVNPTVTPGLVTEPVRSQNSWSDEDFWQAFNQMRVLHGVNPIEKDDKLCTVTSYRLIEALSLDDIDSRQSMEELVSNNSEISDILLSYSSVLEVITAWDGDLDSIMKQLQENQDVRSVLAGGEYVWGCASSEDSITVIMVAF